jgi:addiction module RelE/StbE family toxin
MLKYLISITEAAERDLADIVEYIANDSPIAALKVADEIEESILQLEEFPLSGVTPKNPRLARQGYRMLIVDNYLVFYVLLEDEAVEIRRIISGKREYRFLL